MAGWKVGDTQPALSGTAKNGTAGAPLTGATAVVHIRRPGELSAISRAATLGNQTTSPGSWSMAWQATDLAEAGVYEVELEVTWSPGNITTFPGGDRLTVFRVGEAIA